MNIQNINNQSKHKEQKIVDKIKCDTAKFNLNYYLNKKYLEDETINHNQLYNFNTKYFSTIKKYINTSQNKLINYLVHTFKNQKKDRQKNSLVTKLAFLKSSKQVVIGYNRPDRGDINFIDTTKPRVAEFFYKQLAGGLGGLAPYQDGRKIIIADRKGKFTWIDVLTKDLKQINDKAITTAYQGIVDISLSPSQTKIACGSKQKVIFIFDIQSLKTTKISQNVVNPQKRLINNPYSVVSIMWHQYKSILVSSSIDYAVKLWDIRSEQSIHSSKYHTDDVSKCLFHPNGNTYFSMSKDKTILQYDLRMRGILTKFQLEQQPKDMQIVNNLIVAGDSMGTLSWFTKNGQIIFSKKGDSSVLALAVDQSMDWMVVARKENNIFELYEVNDYCL